MQKKGVGEMGFIEEIEVAKQSREKCEKRLKL